MSIPVPRAPGPGLCGGAPNGLNSRRKDSLQVLPAAKHEVGVEHGMPTDGEAVRRPRTRPWCFSTSQGKTAMALAVLAGEEDQLEQLEGIVALGQDSRRSFRELLTRCNCNQRKIICHLRGSPRRGRQSSASTGGAELCASFAVVWLVYSEG